MILLANEWYCTARNNTCSRNAFIDAQLDQRGVEGLILQHVWYMLL